MHNIIKHIIPDALINHKFPPPPYGHLTWGILTYMGVLYYWEPPIMGKQLVSFITCGCESSAPFFAIYKAGREPMPYWW